jgi:hypothetical protein
MELDLPKIADKQTGFPKNSDGDQIMKLICTDVISVKFIYIVLDQ